MDDFERIIKDWKAVLSGDPLDAPWDLIDETIELLKEYKNEKERNPVIVCPHCGKRVK